MAGPKWFRAVLIVSYIWRQMGYGAVIYVATLSTVDPQLYEAAAIDGCNKWKQVFYITIPSIKPTIVTMLLLNLSHVLLIFEQIMVMYNASVYSVSDVLQTYTYREGILSGNIAYGTAISLFTGIVSLVLVMSTNWISSISWKIPFCRRNRNYGKKAINRDPGVKRKKNFPGCQWTISCIGLYCCCNSNLECCCNILCTG